MFLNQIPTPSPEAGVTAMNAGAASWIPAPVGADSRAPSFPQTKKIGIVRPHGWESGAGSAKQ